jgi:apolipoprotein N-acyltransferase
MSKSKTYFNNTNDSSQKKDWVRNLSLGIIATCILLLLGLMSLMVWRTTNNNPEVYRVIVTSDITPDSLKAYNYMNSEQADSLINAIKTYDAQLIQKYQYLVEQKEQDSQIFFWGSLIVGIIIAVFGWFGFQSFTTIEDKAKKKAENVAKNVAQRTAWKETKNYLTEEGKKLIEKTAKENRQDAEVVKIKDQVKDELNTIIENRLKQYMPSNKYDELEKRIESLEKSVIADIDKSVREAVKDMLGKYMRPKKTSKDTEEGK